MWSGGSQVLQGPVAVVEVRRIKVRSENLTHQPIISLHHSCGNEWSKSTGQDKADVALHSSVWMGF